MWISTVNNKECHLLGLEAVQSFLLSSLSYPLNGRHVEKKKKEHVSCAMLLIHQFARKIFHEYSFLYLTF